MLILRSELWIILEAQLKHMSCLPVGKSALALRGHGVEQAFCLPQPLDQPNEIELFLKVHAGPQDNI